VYLRSASTKKFGGIANANQKSYHTCSVKLQFSSYVAERNSPTEKT